jgi:hypothetical protein
MRAGRNCSLSQAHAAVIRGYRAISPEPLAERFPERVNEQRVLKNAAGDYNVLVVERRNDLQHAMHDRTVKGPRNFPNVARRGAMLDDSCQ